MAIKIIKGRTRFERVAALEQLSNDWWQLHKAAQARRYDSVIWHLHKMKVFSKMHKMSLPEMLVASGSIK